MVSPIYFIVVPLLAAFALGFLPTRWRTAGYAFTLAALAVSCLIASFWVWTLATGAAETVDVLTAGTPPPFAVNLRLGLAEAALVLLINLTTMLSVVHLKQTLLETGRRAMAVLLIFSMALCGVVMTRDLFNLFVFFELVVIATGGLVLLSKNPFALGAGFKFLVASQVISMLMLVGIIFAYHATGSLNIDFMAGDSALLGGAGTIAFFLIFISLIGELKVFPANGWALDIYESAHPAFSALVSAAMGSATIYAVDKLIQIGGAPWMSVASVLGVISFVGANLFALVQTNDRRLLGYSSVGQIGLILAVVGQQDILGEYYLYVAGGILLAHAIGKAGLYWMSGVVAGRALSDWAALRSQPLLVFAFIIFISLLVGLPPFPGFYAKWELVHKLAGEGRLLILGLLLFGALLEAGYLFRWLGYVIKRELPAEPIAASVPQYATITAAVTAGWGVAYLWGALSPQNNLLLATPMLFALAFLPLEGLPAKLKNILAIGGLLAWFWMNYSIYDPLQLIFAIIILVGGAVIFLASFQNEGRRLGFYPSALLMYAGLAMLITADDAFTFFAAWESLTIGSYFLILRGRFSEPHALSYLVFSLGGAFLILAGFALAGNGNAGFMVRELQDLTQPIAPWVFLLLAIGFMTKTASFGLHIWLPGAHAEAETDVSPVVSGILLKAGLFGLFTLLIYMGRQVLFGIDLTHAMMWIGALSALLGNLMAVFQEDAKRLLAYSSIGQMGYALFGLAMMNHLGWLMALMFVVNHYIYKSMLFLSVGGVAKRTGTRAMYQMGGLITLMPLSFIAILIGIIAMSGVPPLSGFGGRWIFYNAIMTAEYKLPIVLVFLSGPIAFLYLFRLIHTIFLGQLKDEHRKVKEAPFWLVLPQMIFVVCLLAFALVPGLALRHVDAYISRFLPEGALNWEGLTIHSDFGYWSPISIMLIVGVMFASVFALLLFVNRRAQKVKQFNIVFAAERPYRPETTHYAWNFYAPYRKALGFLTRPLVECFWATVVDFLHSLADILRRFYNGNGQVYAMHLLAFVVITYFLSMGA